MKFKKAILAAALTTAFSAAFADDTYTIDNNIEGNNYGIVIEDLNTISNLMIASAINDAKIDGSINLNAEIIRIDSTESTANATATAVGSTSVSEAVANAVSGNIFKTLVVGAQNTADLSASIDSEIAFNYETTFNSDDTTTTTGYTGIYGEDSGPMVQGMNAVSMAVNNFDLNASVNITSAIDTARLDGWVFDRTIADSLATLDVQNLSISTTAVGAINNTMMSLNNVNKYSFTNISTTSLTTAATTPTTPTTP